MSDKTEAEIKAERMLKKLRESPNKPMTPENRRKQMISFVMGTMGDDNPITKEEIEAILAKKHGWKEAS